MQTRTASLLAALWLGGIGAFAASPAPAQSPMDLLAQLDAPDYPTRQAAMEQLLAGPDLTPRQWQELMAAADSPEQRHRILAAARHHLLRRLRQAEFPDRHNGSLGVIQHVPSPAEQQVIGRPGIIVSSTLPGFPAYAHLRPGDLIIALNDVVIGENINDENFQSLVRMNEAGKQVTLRIVRDGQEIERSFALASLEALTRMYERTDVGLTARFEERWRQLRGELMNPSADAAPFRLEAAAPPL